MAVNERSAAHQDFLRSLGMHGLKYFQKVDIRHTFPVQKNKEVRKRGENMTNYEKVLQKVVKYHSGQTRNDGSPYINHPFAVAEILRICGYDERYQIAGLFHDLLEDTRATEKEIAAFGEDILEAVKLLTRAKGQPEDEYVAAILGNDMAAAVKSADKVHNLISAVCNDGFGVRWTAKSRRFAERYLKKAKLYYEGNFCEEMDRIIDVVENALNEDETPTGITINPPAMKLYTTVEKEAYEKRRAAWNTDERPPFDSPDLHYCKFEEDGYFAFLGDKILSAKKRWILTTGGWAPQESILTESQMTDLIFNEEYKVLTSKAMQKEIQGMEFDDFVTMDSLY